MKDDPAIDRIREVRRQISEAYDHDSEKLIKHYQELQKKTKRKFFKKDKNENKVA